MNDEYINLFKSYFINNGITGEKDGSESHRDEHIKVENTSRLEILKYEVNASNMYIKYYLIVGYCDEVYLVNLDILDLIIFCNGNK